MGWIISVGIIIGVLISGGAPSADILFLTSGLFAIAGSMPRVITINKKSDNSDHK